MSTNDFVRRLLCAAFLIGCCTTATAEQPAIPPYKDDLFSRMTVMQSADDGAFKVIDYQEMRDINGRDREPERHVNEAYVSLGVRRLQENETLQLAGNAVDVTRVGPAQGAAFTIIFIHGRGGDRRLGVNDYTFGGNFNRLKNLTASNGGTYYSPSVKSFGDAGVRDIGALVRYAFEQSSGRPVILACASMGGFICQGISRDPEAVRYLKGMVLLGGPPDPKIASTALARLKIPLYFAHGSADSVYKADDEITIFRQLRKAGYPTQYTLFQTGTHGTPIRMVDWREVLNFTLQVRK
jgi:hypothetical protein